MSMVKTSTQQQLKKLIFNITVMVETLGMKNNKKRYMIGRSQKVKDAGKNDLQHGHLTSFFGLNKKHNE